MATVSEVKGKLVQTGISETDAKAIAECVVTKCSCSWTNTDEVDNEVLQKLGDLIKEKEYNITVKVDEVPTRNKYIWEVKVLP